MDGAKNLKLGSNGDMTLGAIIFCVGQMLIFIQMLCASKRCSKVQVGGGSQEGNALLKLTHF